MSFDLRHKVDMRWQLAALSFAIVLGISCGITAAFPAIDLAVSGWFFDLASGSWPVAQNPFLQAIRKMLWRLADVAAVAAIAVVILRTLVPHWRKRGRAAAGFLALSYLLGPGLIVNMILKEHWGRARPFDVTEFGGPHLFTPALTLTDQCTHNCSFVGGEASSFAALFFVLFFMFRAEIHSRTAFRTLGTAFCIAVFGSLLRVAFGHHFLSDIFFAWATMFALVAAMAVAFDRLGWDYHWNAAMRNSRNRNEQARKP